MAFLCVDRVVSPMHLGALAIFRPGGAGDSTRVAAVLAQRAERVWQLRRRVRPSWLPFAAASWADDCGFSAKDHIQVHHLDRSGGMPEVAAMAGELMIRPLPRCRPLWEFHVIAGTGWDRFGVLFKLHHAFGDGMGVLEIGRQVLDEVTLRGRGARRRGEVANEAAPASESTVLTRLGQLRDTTSIAASVLRSVRLPDPASPLLISSSGRWALALAALDLQQVRQIRARYGGTVNDVLLSVVTGALREWLRARGGSVDDVILRAFIPVSQRARSGKRVSGNRLSGYLCTLPVGQPDPRERLLMIRRSMERNRAAGTGGGVGAVPLLADRLPAVVHRLATPVAGQCVSLLFDLAVTSIPVPSIRFTLDGGKLEDIYPIAPLLPGHALVIGLSWYQDRAYLALNADREGLPDVHRLAEAIQPAIEALNGLVE
jgi:diacylglycerol O-acyltransferase